MTSSCKQLYAYPEPNSVLMANLSLLSHPEGGYYAETERIADEIPSPYTQPPGKSRSIATQIYYLITPQSSRGRMHLNLGTTFHTLHAGRALYTLFRPATATTPQELKHVVLGANSAAGEVKQLFVPGGWWKASEIPQADLAGLEKDAETGAYKAGEGENVGCIISEVVVPGFDFEDHAFLGEDELVEMFGGNKEDETVQKLLPYVRPA